MNGHASAAPHRDVESDGITRVFSCLADAADRRTLGRLYERAPDGMTLRDLAVALAADAAIPTADREDAAVDRRQVTLHHRTLPKLDAAGLIDRDRGRGTISLADHPAFGDDGIVAAITGEAVADADSLDSLFGALAAPSRRTILDALSHQLGPIHVETLARELIARERGAEDPDGSPTDARRTLIGLHHTHLPTLAAAGLIDYDTERGTVAYRGHPELRVPWMHSVFEPAFDGSVVDGPPSAETGTIRGREPVVSFGQSLFERAERELFCMVTQSDLIEAGCLARLRDAADRGVAVYLGTRDEAVREFVREHAPAVVLWEPERNWLNLPVAGNNVGRLVLADREAVLLGTLREATGGDEPREQAIVGEGADNVLAVTVTQLLRPYLDRVDAASPDVESHRPF